MLFSNRLVLMLKINRIFQFSRDDRQEKTKTNEEKLFWVEKTYGKKYSQARRFFQLLRTNLNLASHLGENEEDVVKVYSYAVIIFILNKTVCV